MEKTSEALKKFAVELFKINAVKFGEFKTKSGLMTPIYCDLRVIVSYPALMETLAEFIIEKYKNIKDIDIICGVPYTALPIATAVSLKSSIPMVMRRKEAKAYGTKKLVEGLFNQGDSCLVVEDVVTSGGSILETVSDLRKEGIKCSQTIVVLNREQGGSQILQSKGITMHALFTLSELVEFLYDEKCISKETLVAVKKYISETQVDSQIFEAPATKNRLKIPFSERSLMAKNPVASDLFEIMSTKQTNLCVAVDVTNSTALLNIMEEIGPYICALKTHIDILEDFHENLVKHLIEVSKKHKFILFEDRKFADIGKTVELQYSKGIYKISSWAKLVTAHSLMGKGVLDAIKGSSGLSEKGVFLLAEASAAGNLIDKNYTNATISLANEYPELVTGIVCQSPIFLDNPGFIQLIPGVQMEAKNDHLGQQYKSPESAVLECGGDVVVVGRGITNASNPSETALNYKNVLWEAYKKRIEN